MEDLSFEKVSLILGLLGVWALVADRVTKRLQSISPIVGETLEFIDNSIDAVTVARSAVMEAFEDGKIDESELKAAAAILHKAAKGQEQPELD